MPQIDRLFSELNPPIGGFEFDENVARVFDDMIVRSIPLYADVQRMLPALADLLDHDVLKIVDLGCSTGTSLIHLASRLNHRDYQLIGVDNSPAMLEQCRAKMQALGIDDRIQLQHRDIRDAHFDDASIVLMNYTLQFIDVQHRPNLLQQIHQRLRPGGFLLISEKVVHRQPQMDHALVELYFDFKRRNGYTELEISRKREALENVLVPLTVDDNQRMLMEAGFGEVDLILKWFNFATMIARH